MDTQAKTSELQRVIDTVESLPMDDQMLVIDIIRQRLIQHRRADLAAQVAEARRAYQTGEVHRGTVEDLLRDLDA
jgi:hypothetical protein